MGVVTPSRRSENGFSENGEGGKRGASRIASPWRGVTPLCGSQRMDLGDNGECKLPFCGDITRYF